MEPRPRATRAKDQGPVVGWWGGGVGWWGGVVGYQWWSGFGVIFGGGVDRGGRLVAVSVTDTEHPNRPGRWGRPGEYQS